MVPIRADGPVRDGLFKIYLVVNVAVGFYFGNDFRFLDYWGLVCLAAFPKGALELLLLIHQHLDKFFLS